jgi:hypothetical protein
MMTEEEEERAIGDDIQREEAMITEILTTTEDEEHGIRDLDHESVMIEMITIRITGHGILD